MKQAVTGACLLLLAAAGQAGDLLDEVAAVQAGTFTTEAQSSADPRYENVRWHIVEVWRGRGLQERWFYTESWLDQAKGPYIQRITRLARDGAGTIVASRYMIPEAGRFVDAWREPGRLDSLQAKDLIPLPGCEVIIVRTGPARFEGSTVGDHCRNSYMGSAYAVSKLVLTAEGMTNWDRGFDADGNQKWGPVDGGYQFRRSPAPVVR
jgi:hypothetical protein